MRGLPLVLCVYSKQLRNHLSLHLWRSRVQTWHHGSKKFWMDISLLLYASYWHFPLFVSYRISQNSNNLLPDYITGGANFSEASSSAALASVAYRAATINPSVFGSNYTTIAGKIRDAIFAGIDDLGVMSPLVDPLNWGSVGILSTEGQAFGLMMFAAWKEWLGLWVWLSLSLQVRCKMLLQAKSIFSAGDYLHISQKAADAA